MDFKEPTFLYNKIEVRKTGRIARSRNSTLILFEIEFLDKLTGTVWAHENELMIIEENNDSR